MRRDGMNGSSKAAACFVAVISVLLAGPLQAAHGEVLRGSAPDGSGGGEIVLSQHLDEPTPELRRQIQEILRANTDLLRSQGKSSTALGAHPLMQFPLASWNGLDHERVHGISNYVDHNAAFPN